MFGWFSRFGQFMSVFQIGSTDEEGTVEMAPTAWYDHVFNFLMRMVRPLIVFGFFYMMYLAWKYPVDVTTFGKALKEIPEYLQYTLIAVVLSVAIPKMVTGMRKPPSTTTTTVTAVTPAPASVTTATTTTVPVQATVQSPAQNEDTPTVTPSGSAKPADYDSFVAQLKP